MCFTWFVRKWIVKFFQHTVILHNPWTVATGKKNVCTHVEQSYNKTGLAALYFQICPLVLILCVFSRLVLHWSQLYLCVCTLCVLSFMCGMWNAQSLFVLWWTVLTNSHDMPIADSTHMYVWLILCLHLERWVKVIVNVMCLYREWTFLFNKFLNVHQIQQLRLTHNCITDHYHKQFIRISHLYESTFNRRKKPSFKVNI